MHYPWAARAPSGATDPLKEDVMKSPIAMLLTCAALAVPGRLLAQIEPPAISGAVVSSGNTSLVIDADDGTKRTFLIDTTTTLPTSLAAGNRVMVQYQTLDADRAQALSVNLLTPDAASASAPSTQPPAMAASEERPGGPVSVGTPVSMLSVATVGVVAAAVVFWVFARRRREETPHLSL
jgi:hypothetical protein